MAALIQKACMKTKSTRGRKSLVNIGVAFYHWRHFWRVKGLKVIKCCAYLKNLFLVMVTSQFTIWCRKGTFTINVFLHASSLSGVLSQFRSMSVSQSFNLEKDVADEQKRLVCLPSWGSIYSLVCDLIVCAF